MDCGEAWSELWDRCRVTKYDRLQADPAFQRDLRNPALSSRKAADKWGVGKTYINTLRAALHSPVEALGAGPRILAFDLELTPLTAYTWSLWPKSISIGQLVDSAEVICFGARWLGTSEVIFRSTFHDGKEAMLGKLYELVDQADTLMGWNSKGFDRKHMNREFLEAGFYPPSPSTDLDLMLEVKKHFRFPSNKLDYVAQRLGVGSKVSHTGFDLWLRCMAGDAEAWEIMRTYQIQDVNLLIELHGKLRPWLKSAPNWGLYTGDVNVCPSCGSADIDVDVAPQYTQVSKFPGRRCLTCGTTFRSPVRSATTDSRR